MVNGVHHSNESHKSRRPHSIDILRVVEVYFIPSEYFGYDENEYPEEMLQRVAG